MIDADKLYDWVKRECNPYGKPTIDFESGNRMLDMIKRSSTAFDKDKVIEELENYLFEKYCVEGDSRIDEIVEKGGIEFLH